MTRIERIVEVNASVHAAYSQWTCYEDYPKFMENVHEVRQTGPHRLHWRAQRHGRDVEWTSEITTEEPDKKISWRDTDGPRNDGMVLFYAVDEAHTRVQLVMHDNEKGAPEEAAKNETELIHRLEHDLLRFKIMMEHPEALSRSAGTS